MTLYFCLFLFRLQDFFLASQGSGGIFGNQDLVGGKMKSTGTSLWASPNAEATNESGFTGLPGGARGISGLTFVTFDNIGNYGYWWSSTQFNTFKALGRNLYYGNQAFGVDGIVSKQVGYSVRCLRD